jgi:serine/threonine-protein kinase
MSTDRTDPAVLATPASGGGESLPTEILAEASRRVQVAGVAFAAVWALTLGIMVWVARVHPGAPGLATWPMPAALFSLIGITASVALALYSRRLRSRPGLVLNLGLAFQVVTAALVAFSTHWHAAMSPARISWVCAVILGYAVVAPSTMGRMLAGGLLAASMDPLAAGIAAGRGAVLDREPLLLLNLFLPNYICAVAATASAHLVRTLGRQVRRARELGAYRLGASIGRGGMGEVFRAEHRLLARPAAIKLIRPDVLGSGQMRHIALERFRREAKAAATLRSPHTIDLYDFGEARDGTCYYVMELLDGLSFEELVLRFGPTPVERAVYLMRQACDSLAEAHACGIIHRDLKPSNLMISRLGLTVDFVKVLDFGLVKFDTRDKDRPPTLTSPDVATGTPAFMAPEVASGERKADHRLDIYSLGCVLYWLVTGRLVFEGENSIRMMHRHIAEPPAPPSQRTELPVPAAFDAVVLACLAKKPDDRPASAAELAERLATVPFDEPWTPERARRWWELHLPPVTRTSTPRTHATLVPQVTPE